MHIFRHAPEPAIRDEPDRRFYDSAESLYLLIPAGFTRELTTWPQAEIEKQIPPTTTCVHLPLQPGRISSRVGQRAARGIRAGNERIRTVQYEGATVYIVLEDVQTHGG